MKIWRNSYRDKNGESKGFSFHACYLDAKRAKEIAAADASGRETQTEAFDIQPSKDGIIQALNKFGGHNDNG